MKSKKRKIFLLIFSLLFFIGTLSVHLLLFQVDKKTAQNTTEYVATVTKISINDMVSDVYAEIFTQEYDNSFFISSNIAKHINLEDLKNIQSGDKVYVRIENDQVNLFDRVEFISIVSLTAANKQIYSLTNYNDYMTIAAKPARIISIFVALVFLCLAIYCIVILRRNT